MPIIQHDNWDVAAVFDDAGNVIQFNTLDPESGYEEVLIEQVHTAGNYQSGTRNKITLASLELDGIVQLQNWAANYTPLKAVALAPGVNGTAYLWQKPCKLADRTVVPKPVRSDGDGYVRVVLDGYDINPLRLTNLATGQTGNGEIILPVADIELTLAGEHTGSFSLKLEAFDFNNTSLGAVNHSFSNERGSVSLNLPSNTWKVVWTVGNATDITLRRASQSDYVAY